MKPNFAVCLFIVLLSLSGCSEGQKPTPLKRVEPSTERPAEAKAAKDLAGKGKQPEVERQK